MVDKTIVVYGTRPRDDQHFGDHAFKNVLFRSFDGHRVVQGDERSFKHVVVLKKFIGSNFIKALQCDRSKIIYVNGGVTELKRKLLELLGTLASSTPTPPKVAVVEAPRAQLGPLALDNMDDDAATDDVGDAATDDVGDADAEEGESSIQEVSGASPEIEDNPSIAHFKQLTAAHPLVYRKPRGKKFAAWKQAVQVMRSYAKKRLGLETEAKWDEVNGKVVLSFGRIHTVEQLKQQEPQHVEKAEELNDTASVEEAPPSAEKDERIKDPEVAETYREAVLAVIHQGRLTEEALALCEKFACRYKELKG